MSEPIVFISRSRVAAGMRVEFEAAFRGLVEVMAETRPRTALMAAYLDATETEVSVVHVFPDPGAMAEHFVGSEDRTASASSLITLTGFDVYGPAPVPAVEQLRQEAADGGFDLVVRTEPIGGFLRGSS